MRNKFSSDCVVSVDDFCCGAVRAQHTLFTCFGLSPESSVPVVADCAYPKPARVSGGAFNNFFPEAFFFVTIHNFKFFRLLVGKLPGGNFGANGVRILGLYDIESISYKPKI